MALQTESRPRRLIPRFPLTQQVVVRGSGLAPRSYAARDVSQGGFFLATEDAFELFSDVELEVVLPTGQPTTLRARVVHVLSPDKAQSFGVPAGIGVQYEGLSDQERAHVQALVAWARSNDPRARIARRKPTADLSTLQSEPMLSYLFDHVDGQRDPEALAEELGVEVGSVERMLRELCRLDVIDLVAASGHAAPTAAVLPPTAAGARHQAEAPSLVPQQKRELTELEHRLSRGNLYSALDVPEAASAESIRARFQVQSAALRGWIAPAPDMARVERVQNQLSEAYGVLSSPHKRLEYDQYLERGRVLAQTEALRAKLTAAEASPPAQATNNNQPASHKASAAREQPERIPQPSAAMRARPAPRPSSATAQAAAQPAPLGAAAQILAQAEQAHAAGKLAEANKHLQLLTAMSFDDAKIRARVANLKTRVSRALAVDFEKQAAYEEKQQRWALAARSWLQVAEGRPKDSVPLQRAALAQLQAGVDLKQVLELAKRAVELANADPEAHRTLARVYVAAGMQANARRELEAAQRCAAPAIDGASKTTAKAKPERSLFKRLLGREAPN